MIPFADYLPDRPPMEGSSLAKNVLPAVNGYRKFPSLATVSSALGAYCRGGLSLKDSDGNTYTFVGDASLLYTLNSATFSEAVKTKTGTDIAFTASNTISSTTTDLSVFNDNETITISGSGSNSGTFTVNGTPTATSMVVDESVSTEAAGSSVTIKRTFNSTENSFWRFEKWGDAIIATNYLDDVQILALGASEFDQMSTTAPKARYVTVVGSFVVLGYVTSGGTAYAFRIQWSGIGDETDFTPAAATQSGYNDLFGKGGPITALLGGDVGYVFQERSIQTMTYIGPPDVFAFSEVETDRGTSAPGSAIRIGNDAFYLGPDGFYRFNGAVSEPIGAEMVDRDFFDDYDATYYYRVSAVADAKNHVVLWAYPGQSNTDGRPNKILAYNWVLRKWTIIEQEVEFLMRFLSSGYTLDSLDAIEPDLDAMTISLDSDYWKGGVLNVAGFDSSHQLGTFSGTAKAATVRTVEHEHNPGMFTHASSIRVFSDASLTVKVGTRNDQEDSITWSSAYSENSYDDSIDLREEARFITYEIITTGDFTYIEGYRPKGVPAGER